MKYFMDTFIVYYRKHDALFSTQFVVQIANTKRDYFSVGVQNKRQKKNFIRIWVTKMWRRHTDFYNIDLS